MKDLLITDLGFLTAKDIKNEMVSVWNNAKLTMGNTNGAQGVAFGFKQVVIKKAANGYKLGVKHYTTGKILATYEAKTLAETKKAIKKLAA